MQDPGADVARAVLQPAAKHLGLQLTAARSTLPAELAQPAQPASAACPTSHSAAAVSWVGTVSESSTMRQPIAHGQPVLSSCKLQLFVTMQLCCF